MDSVLVANSTPMVDLESRLNSLRVNLDKTADGTFRKYCIRGHEGILGVRFLFAGLPPRQYGQIIREFRDVVRTIFRHQSHQSKRPVRGLGLRVRFNVSQETTDGP